MIDLGPLHYYIRIEVTQHTNQIFLSQSKYFIELLNKFWMECFNAFLTPMEHNLKLSKIEGGKLVNSKRYKKLIGSLIYLTNN
jgi:hypothetical protein